MGEQHELFFFLVILSLAAYVAARLLPTGKSKARSGRRPKRRKSWAFWSKKPVNFYLRKPWRDLRKIALERNRVWYGLSEGVWRCERCGVLTTRPELDHWLARSKWKWLQHALWNTQVLCEGPEGCNQRKRDKWGYHWRWLRRCGLTPVVWVLRWHQEAKGWR